MKNVPNILTIFRFFLVPVFLVVFFSELAHRYWVAAAVFLLAGATDVLDGRIARKYHLVSTFGEVMDPLADKCMQLAVIISLFWEGLVPLWAIVVIFGKELLMILGGVMLYFRRSKTTIPANWYGKVVTCLVYATVLYLMFFPQTGLFEDWVATALIFLTVAGTVFSLIMYFICFTKVAQK